MVLEDLKTFENNEEVKLFKINGPTFIPKSNEEVK